MKLLHWHYLFFSHYIYFLFLFFFLSLLFYFDRVLYRCNLKMRKVETWGRIQRSLALFQTVYQVGMKVKGGLWCSSAQKGHDGCKQSGNFPYLYVRNGKKLKKILHAQISSEGVHLFFSSTIRRLLYFHQSR